MAHFLGELSDGGQVVPVEGDIVHHVRHGDSWSGLLCMPVGVGVVAGKTYHLRVADTFDSDIRVDAAGGSVLSIWGQQVEFHGVPQTV